MEDERIISITAQNSKLTAEFLIKAIFTGRMFFYRRYQDKKLGDRIFHGETEWSKFMKSIDPITMRDLTTNEVNLDKFKEELEKYNIGFSFYKHADGKTTSVAFSIKHKDIVEKSLSETLEKVVKSENFTENVKKAPKKKDLQEKLNYYKQVEKVMKDDLDKGITEKVSTKGEKSL